MRTVPHSIIFHKCTVNCYKYSNASHTHILWENDEWEKQEVGAMVARYTAPWISMAIQIWWKCYLIEYKWQAPQIKRTFSTVSCSLAFTANTSHHITNDFQWIYMIYWKILSDQIDFIHHKYHRHWWYFIYEFCTIFLFPSLCNQCGKKLQTRTTLFWECACTTSEDKSREKEKKRYIWITVKTDDIR